MVIEDLGCWKDTINRAIQRVEGKHPLLKDSYRSRTDAYEKCLKAPCSLDTKYLLYRMEVGLQVQQMRIRPIIYTESRMIVKMMAKEANGQTKFTR